MNELQAYIIIKDKRHYQFCHANFYINILRPFYT